MKHHFRVLLLASVAGLPLSTAMAQAANDLLAPQVTSGAAPAPAASTQTAVADPDRMICKSESVTGSTLPKRVCKTASQRAAEAQASRNFLDQSSRKHSSFGGG
ncbi:MAG: hypothetical protein JWQ90_5636 [Hydrocarboniphaga sp.]|uniref:hypothetical protein n=1 Tax=Hydrocarboniphaga sp. TaxID=2033016 RepID=UPI002636E1C3|nr:hypothetical protein [Hydrocarboniphaga sp.]MDB5973186.1 hypothetical protein [Hydrocarboniphaga sp.]